VDAAGSSGAKGAALSSNQQQQQKQQQGRDAVGSNSPQSADTTPKRDAATAASADGCGSSKLAAAVAVSSPVSPCSLNAETEEPTAAAARAAAAIAEQGQKVCNQIQGQSTISSSRQA
jgi:hypothetical protein